METTLAKRKKRVIPDMGRPGRWARERDITAPTPALWLRERREELGMSRRTLARLTGACEASLLRWERTPRNTMGVRVLCRLADALLLKPYELMRDYPRECWGVTWRAAQMINAKRAARD